MLLGRKYAVILARKGQSGHPIQGDCSTPMAFEVVQLSKQSIQRVSIRVARPEARRACESLVPFAKLPTPIANALGGCGFFESEESTHHAPRDVASKTRGF